MAKRMLIDASHREETRVVVMSGNRVEEFDYESANRQQLKGNIYLAKVTRVEPSLQAAFVDYGGNRHGFLPFNEIHSDYYRIPVADREALIEEEAAIAGDRVPAADGDDKPADRAAAGDGDEDAAGADIEVMGGDDVEDASQRRARHTRRYKIQEVIKRRQIMLVQVTKEERGNKGAALTTYLSLPGRYCVLMPNTPRGGGISRKIVSHKDRRRLKSILEDLEIPGGVSVIVRTAGSERSKAEIRRDYEYLLRLWNQIREETLQSSAPALIYEEANIIKRAIRDLYARDMDEILVEGPDGYKSAKSFMRMLMPSHAKFVQQYRDDGVPLLQRYKVESQLDAIHQNTVQLKSGGYIVINPTEALVSIDVNSGRATRERHIEETALKTNLEAAEEVARQLRLRDLAGLIVIDFIDMEENRHNHQVERKLKEALRHDRARIQVGHISPFGLLEMSRQRLRPSLAEASTEICPHCGGSGAIRSTESTTLTVLRAIEEIAVRRRLGEVHAAVPTSVALYLLNQKRHRLHDMEERLGLRVFIDADDSLIPPSYRMDQMTEVEAEDEGEGDEQVAGAEDKAAQEREGAAGEGRRKRRTRRGRRSRTEETDTAAAESAAEEGQDEEAAGEAEAGEAAGEDGTKRRRRRGKRGGRRRARGRDRSEAQVAAEPGEPPTAAASCLPTEQPDEADLREGRAAPVAASAAVEDREEPETQPVEAGASVEDAAASVVEAAASGGDEAPATAAEAVADAATEPQPEPSGSGAAKPAARRRSRRPASRTARGGAEDQASPEASGPKAEPGATADRAGAAPASEEPEAKPRGLVEAPQPNRAAEPAPEAPSPGAAPEAPPAAAVPEAPAEQAVPPSVQTERWMESGEPRVSRQDAERAVPELVNASHTSSAPSNGSAQPDESPRDDAAIESAREKPRRRGWWQRLTE
jgi:ribonuclease E